MRYISDDGKIFNTEHECCGYEQKIKKAKEDEKIKEEKLEFERKNMMNQICQKRKELIDLTKTYESKFGVTIEEYLPFGEFLKILYGC